MAICGLKPPHLGHEAKTTGLMTVNILTQFLWITYQRLGLPDNPKGVLALKECQAWRDGKECQPWRRLTMLGEGKVPRWIRKEIHSVHLSQETLDSSKHIIEVFPHFLPETPLTKTIREEATHLLEQNF